MASKISLMTLRSPLDWCEFRFKPAEESDLKPAGVPN
jgi:hypothetical protein